MTTGFALLTPERRREVAAKGGRGRRRGPARNGVRERREAAGDCIDCGGKRVEGILRCEGCRLATCSRTRAWRESRKQAAQ